MSQNAVVWFRRDLRVHDQPTFLAAAPRALALFVLDPALLGPSGAARSTFLFRSLRCLDGALDGKLQVVEGDPAEVVPRVAAAVDATAVHVAADYGPHGRTRDEAVEKALAGGGRELVRSGSPYAVAPGRVRKPDGDPYKVFTPFRRAWAEHGWRRPADTDAATVAWLDPVEESAVPDDLDVDAELPDAGEDAAHHQWHAFLGDAVGDYAGGRDRPDREGTSRMSVYLTQVRPHPPPHAPTRPARTSTVPSTPCPSRRGRRRAPRSAGGARAAPASRSSTPGCASCASRPGCTSGCGCSSRASW